MGFAAEGREWRIRVDGAADVSPVLDERDGRIVWYRGVRDGVDVRYTLSATGVKEDFVVHSPEALKASGDFGVDLVSDAPLVRDETFAGALAWDWDGDGATGWQGKGDGPLVRLPAPVVTDSSDAPLVDVRSRFVVSDARPVEGAAGSRVVRIGVQLDGLDPAAVKYPLVLDPSFEVLPLSMGGTWQSYSLAGSGSTVGTNEWVLFGDWRLFGATDYWRAAVSTGYSRLWTHVAANPRVFSANLKVTSVGGLSPLGPYASIASSFPTSDGAYVGQEDPLLTVCHASAWSHAGAYPGHGGASNCRSGYYYGYSWVPSIQGASGTVNRVDVTDMVRPWVASKTAGNVFGLSAENQTPNYNFKATSPTLEVVWDQLTTAATLTGPADGSSVTSLTPTLSTSTVTDPDAGQTPQYRAVLMASNPGSLANATPEQACGANSALWASSWSASPSFAVPTGILADGVTYWWSMSTVGVFPGYLRCSGPWKFTVNKRLGDASPTPMQTLGPVAVNLATGNVAASAGSNAVSTVGGDIGVNLTYNSQAVASNGLRAQYFGGTPPFTGLAPNVDDALKGSAFLTQVDQKIDHSWGSNGPGTVGAFDHFAARWTGFVTVPNAGAYCFATRASDGTKVWIDGVLV
ncbi:MAG: PA14 domain-containing protein, partial [Actinomycetota bacterium]|nr:PA14 domain-containing protein [Actinomycetota bacterium]